MSSDTANASSWVIHDGAAGNARQALALATALELRPRVIDLQLSHPWDWLAPHLPIGAMRGMRDRHGQPIASPWPDIAIGCGRRAALLTRCLRGWSRKQSFTVQILDPRISPHHFDVVVAPRHDRIKAANVIETVGALNAIDEAWLAEGRMTFAPMGELPQPRTAVLIGASNAAVALDDAYFSALHETLAKRHAAHGGSFLVSTSRRTPPERIESLRREFSGWPGSFWGGPEDGENPYAGILGWADRFIVSADSVNMISEACATGKPVHAFSAEPPSGKMGALLKSLTSRSHVSAVDAHAISEPLRESARVADQIRVLWKRKMSR